MTAQIEPVTQHIRTELRILVRLAVPICLAQFGFVSINLVDTAILGRVSVEDLAAASIARSIFFALGALCIGIGLALDPLAAQALGARRPARAWSALLSTLRAGAMIAAVALILSFVALPALQIIGVEPSVIPRVKGYLIGLAPGYFAFTAFLATKTFLQAHGQTWPIVWASVLANAVNPLICSVLVRGDATLIWLHLPPLGIPALGALGAGLASSISSTIMTAVVMLTAMSYRPKHRSDSDRVPLSKVFAVGIPVGLQLMAEIGIIALVGLSAARLGPRIVGAHQVALALASFSFMGALGVAGATAARVGHAVGAGVSPRRIGLLGLVLGAAIMSIGAVVFAVIPQWLLGLFTTDASVITIGIPLLQLAAIFQLFDGLQVVAAAALRGAGDVRFPFVASVAAYWAVGVPLALFLGFTMQLGAKGLWIGMTASLILIGIVLTARFLRLTKGRLEAIG